MGILVITVDLECSRCKGKITKVLDCLSDEFCIEKVEFEDKENRVIVRGKFDAEKLCMKIRFKACKVVKDIKIVEVWPPAKEEEKDKPKPPETKKPEIKLVPYPYPYPWPCHCHSCKPQAPPPTPPPVTPPPPPPPPPVTPPPPAPTCKCTCTCSHHDGGHDVCRPPQPPCVCDGRPPPIYWPTWPPHQGFVVCPPEDNACSIM